MEYQIQGCEGCWTSNVWKCTWYRFSWL